MTFHEAHQYKPAAAVIHRLCDIVSKNGNLLLSVPQRGDGTIDADERRILEDLAAWMARYGEAIHGTRPWRVFGEGPTRVNAQTDEGAMAYTAQDVRYTTKAAALYAIALGWPKDGRINLTSLAQDSTLAPGAIERVEALGASEPLVFTRTRKGLEVQLPAGLAGSPAIALKLRGTGLA